MKTMLICFCVCFTIAAANNAEPSKPHIDGHADGEIDLEVSFLIADAHTMEPVANAQISFFNQTETNLLKLIEFEKQRHGSTQKIEPKGIVSKTNKEGYVTLQCRFDAAFLLSFESGIEKKVGTDVYPSGRFIVSKEGYVTIDQQAHQMFPGVGYSPDGFAKPTRILIAPAGRGD